MNNMIELHKQDKIQVMKTIQFLITLLLVGCSFAIQCSPAIQAAEKPNIVFVLFDDLPYAGARLSVENPGYDPGNPAWNARHAWLKEREAKR